jgi:protein disulfide-isomerase
MRLLAALLVALLCTPASAAPPIYDEAADANADVRNAVAAAGASDRNVLIVFGANWCGDCKALDLAMKNGASAPLIAKHFSVVKVDVGRFNRNTDVAAAYGVPLKHGIPAVAVLSPDGKVLYVTRAGELADARGMGDEGIARFFSTVAASGR